MKYAVVLLVAAVALIAICQETDGAIAVAPNFRRGLEPPNQGDCKCENCVCKSRFACAQENIVNLPCPGSYIYTCCRQNPTPFNNYKN